MGSVARRQIKFSSFLVIRIGFGRKSISGFFRQLISLAADLLRGDRKQVLKVAMNHRLDFLVALDRFDVLKVNEDESQRRQHHGQTKRKDETETSIGFSFRLHCGAEDTPDSAGLCQAQVKIC